MLKQASKKVGALGEDELELKVRGEIEKLLRAHSYNYFILTEAMK